jgi:cyclopropane-fatty-acyl-phospholipid synthase
MTLRAAGPDTATGAAHELAGLVAPLFGGPLPLRLRAWDGSVAGPDGAPTVVVNDPAALRRLIFRPGELGLAQAYVTGEIDVEGDLLDGFRRVWRSAREHDASPRVSPSTVLAGLKAARHLGLLSWSSLSRPPAPPSSQARLRGRLHSLTRDRDAIAHHYDLSNDFYALLLDDTMAYSSAYFTHTGQSLVDAQRAKLDLICRKLDLKPGMRLLDVGCGWGSLVLHAAEHYGVHATGITLSAQQRDLVAKRIADRGLTDRVEVRLQDYRELADTGETFDAVSSIEMGEHVGEGQYPTYAGIMYRALKPTGRLLLQQMSRRADSAPGGGAFIEAYIAPDMHMRQPSQTVRHLETAGFELRDVEAMREHYVRTVEHWIATFESRYDEFVALQGEEVARVWRLYLVGGALAFEEGRMGVDQFLAVRPTPDGESGMPGTRPWAVGNPST